MSSRQVERWVAANGGIISGGRQERAAEALARLQVPERIGTSLTVSVLDADDPGAFCWRSGAVFITRGLVDLLDDDELAAAIAHEVGHLLTNGQTPIAAALDGCRLHPMNAESAADFAGRELLRRSAVPDAALPRLLNKLAARPATDSSCRECLAGRAARLTSPGGPPKLHW